MYSMLIVEDEKLERMVLKAEIEKQYAEISIMYEAENGLEALRIAQYKNPDLMLVDINIPGISGLELIKTLNDNHFQGKMIITTAYDRFSYIQEALSLGVVGYVLKPIQGAELKHHLRKCFEMIEREKSQHITENKIQETIKHIRSYAQTFLVRDILSGNIPQNLMSNAYGWPPNSELQVFMVCWQPYPVDSQEAQDAFLQECKAVFHALFYILAAVVQDKVILFLQPKMEREDAFLYAAQQVYSSSVIKRLLTSGYIGSQLYVGPLCKTYQDLHQSCEDIISKVNGNEYGQQGKVVFANTQKMNPIWRSKERIKLRQKWVHRIREGQVQRIIAMVKRKLIQPDSYWPGVILFLEALIQYDPAVKAEEVFGLFLGENPFDALGKWITALFRFGDEMYKVASSSEGQARIIQTAMIMLRDRFAHNISEDSFAQEFGISTAYFSRLFKRETGENFVTTVKHMRITQARALLGRGVRNIDKIIEQCGYSNRKYFYDAFKRETGETVTAYLQKINTIHKESL